MTNEEEFRALMRGLSPGWLDIMKVQFERGDNFALLLAVGLCALNGWVMPDWVAENFLRRFELVRDARVKSWDEAFGKPFPKGVHLETLHQSSKLIPAVWSRIRHMRETKLIPVDDALFERVGNDFAIGKTKCKELYYQAERLFSIVSKFPAAKS